MQSQKDCPFCEPNVLGSTFLESKSFRAIYNIAPILPGHSLVVPKRHITSIMDLDPDESADLIHFSKDVVRLLLKAFNASGFDWTIQEGIDAGQTVEHLHLHLIPRKPKDLPNPGDWYPLLVKAENPEVIDSQNRSRISTVEMEGIIRHLKKVASEMV